MPHPTNLSHHSYSQLFTPQFLPPTPSALCDIQSLIKIIPTASLVSFRRFLSSVSKNSKAKIFQTFLAGSCSPFPHSLSSPSCRVPPAHRVTGLPAYRLTGISGGTPLELAGEDARATGRSAAFMPLRCRRQITGCDCSTRFGIGEREAA